MGHEEIRDLLEDLSYALREKPNFEYFLGSFVFQAKPAAPELGRKFSENDLLDGQQILVSRRSWCRVYTIDRPLQI
jgi:hypothetical protein